MQRKKPLSAVVLAILLMLLFTACGEDKSTHTTAKDAATAAEMTISSETAADSTTASSNTDSSSDEDTAHHLEDAVSLAEDATSFANAAPTPADNNNGQSVGGNSGSEKSDTPAQNGSHVDNTPSGASGSENNGSGDDRQNSTAPAYTQSPDHDGDNVEVDINDLP